MTVRKYSSRSQQTTLSSPITSTASTMTVVNGASIMGGKTLTGTQTYTVVIDPDTALEEIVDVTLYSSGNTLTITRGVDGPNPGTGLAHSAGAVVRHMAIGRDYQEANDHIENVTTAHGLTIANVLETTNTNIITSAMIVDGAIVNADINASAAIADTKLATISTAGKVANTATTATSANTASAIVARDASGNFTAGTITANVTGNVSGSSGSTTGNAATATTLATSREFQIVGDVEASAQSFDGSGNVTLTTSIATGAIVNADVNSSAQIAYSKLNLANSVVNADINASAAIDWSKIAPSATVSTTELGYLDGVTSAIQTQIDSKLATSTAASTYAPLASPALTGVPTAPTAAANTNTTQVATTAYVQAEIAELIDAAPGALDTLNELAAALGDDAAFSTTVTTALGTKLPLAGGTMTGAIAMGTNKITGAGDPTSAQDVATKNYVDTASIAPSNLTGPITSVGPATSVAAQTGTGSTFVMNTSPTLVTPDIGVATATSINSTVIPASKTLVATDSTTYVVPSQTGNSGKYLTTDGSVSSWGAVDALPSQTGNSGKYLTTNGTAAAWASIVTDPTPSVFMLMGA
jgi:sulfur carrier protein ThiS